MALSDDIKIITDSDKIKAIEALRGDVKAFILAQEKQDSSNAAIQHKQQQVLRWIRLVSIASFVTVFMGIGFLIYLITKPAPATLIDMRHIKDENENLNTRIKLFLDQKQNFITEQQTYYSKKKYDDSLYIVKKALDENDLARRREDIVRMMANIFKQDSLTSKTVKVVNTRNINTVNTKTVIKK